MQEPDWRGPTVDLREERKLLPSALISCSDNLLIVLFSRFEKYLKYGEASKVNCGLSKIWLADCFICKLNNKIRLL